MQYGTGWLGIRCLGTRWLIGSWYGRILSQAVRIVISNLLEAHLPILGGPFEHLGPEHMQA
jgi:hypothetical protein